MSFIVTTQRIPGQELNQTQDTYLLIMAKGKDSYPAVNSATQTPTGLVFMRTIEQAEARASQTAAESHSSCVFVRDTGSIYTVKPLSTGAFSVRLLTVQNGKILPSAQSQTKHETFVSAAAEAYTLAAAKANSVFVPYFYR